MLLPAAMQERGPSHRTRQQPSTQPAAEGRTPRPVTTHQQPTMARRVMSAAMVSSVHLLVHVCQATPLTHQSSNDLATVVTTAGPVRGIVGNDSACGAVFPSRSHPRVLGVGCPPPPRPRGRRPFSRRSTPLRIAHRWDTFWWFRLLGGREGGQGRDPAERAFLGRWSSETGHPLDPPNRRRAAKTAST
jgi:hypothetical protein